jgi:hypothetical protein
LILVKLAIPVKSATLTRPPQGYCRTASTLFLEAV